MSRLIMGSQTTPFGKKGLKRLSNRKIKLLSKPWITNGIRKSIKKNELYFSGYTQRYKFYRNKISKLIRISKKLYYHEYFTANLNNIKKTWQAINNLLYNKRKDPCGIKSLKRLNDNRISDNPTEIVNIFNQHFASIGKKLTSSFPQSCKDFRDYLSAPKHHNSFYFNPIMPSEVVHQIDSISTKKANGLY